MDWLAAHGHGRTRCAMVAGFYPGLDLERFASLFDAIYLQDLYGLNGNDGLRSLWADEVKRLAPPLRARMRELSSDGDTDMPSASIGLLYLPGEVSPEMVLPCLPVWRRVLDPDAIVCGELYGMANWPDSTTTVAQLFGRPQVEPTGFWRAGLGDAPLRWTANATAAPRASNGSGAIQLMAGDLSDEDVLLSLYSVRKAWPGAIQVNAPQANPALQLQCALLGGNWHARGGGAGFGPGIAISAGTLALGRSDPISRSRKPMPTSTTALRPACCNASASRESRCCLCGIAAIPRGGPGRPGLLAALWRRCTARSSPRSALRPTAPSIIVDPSTLPAFKAQWPKWVFDATPVIIANAGVDQSELDWAAAFERCNS